MRREAAISARIALGCLLVFLLLLAGLQVLRSDYDFRARWLSEYAIGPYGWMMSAAFLALAIAEAMLAIGMLWGENSSAWVRIGAAFLGVAAISLALLAVLPTDLDAPGQVGARLRTSAGRWHDQLGALSGYATLGAMGCWAILFRRAPVWRNLVWPTVVIAGLMVANGVFAPVVVPRAVAGLSQRLGVLLAVAWLGLVGFRVLRRRPVGGASSVAG